MALELGKFPSREASQASIAALEAEIQELEWESMQQGQAMTQRKQQFDTVLQSLITMQESIQQEQLDVVKRQFLKRTTQDDDEEEEGFVENLEESGTTQTSEPTTAADVVPAASDLQQESEEQPPLADGLERVLSMEGHHRHSSSSDRSRRGGSESPRDMDSPNMNMLVSETLGDGGVFALDLQNHPASTLSTPPSRSQTNTPKSGDNDAPGL